MNTITRAHTLSEAACYCRLLLLQYAWVMLSKDRSNATYNAMVDLLLSHMANPNVGSGTTSPTILATLMGDAERLCYLVLKCGGAVTKLRKKGSGAVVGRAPGVFLPDIPTYLSGLWEKDVGRCQAVVRPLHVAVLTKRFDMVRLLLDLGADVNQMAAPKDGEAQVGEGG